MKKSVEKISRLYYNTLIQCMRTVREQEIAIFMAILRIVREQVLYH